MTDFVEYLSDIFLSETINIVQLGESITTHEQFDSLFMFFFSPNKLISKNAALVILQTAAVHSEYLEKSADKYLKLSETLSEDNEKHFFIKLLSLLNSSPVFQTGLFVKFSDWAFNKEENVSVREAAIETLYKIVIANPKFEKAFELLLLKIKTENCKILNSKIDGLC